MSFNSERRVSSIVPRTPAYPLRLCRGWVAGCMDQPGITFTHRQRPSECCLHGERAWLLADEQSFLGAFFDLGVARHIRDAASRYASLQQVDALLARCSEEQPTHVEVGLFRAEEFERLITLDQPTALELLRSLLEALEASLPRKSARADERIGHNTVSAPTSDAPTTVPSRSRGGPANWHYRRSTITVHRMLQQLHRLAREGRE